MTKMKKTIMKKLIVATIVLLGIASVVVAETPSIDVARIAKTGAKSVTKIDYAVIQKFGEYYRTERGRVKYLLNGRGQITGWEETDEHGAVTQAQNTFDANGREATSVCTMGGKILWRRENIYEGDTLREINEYLENGSLTAKTIFKYDPGRTEESDYSGDGKLSQKIITVTDGSHTISTIYNGDGLLEATDESISNGGNTNSIKHTEDGVVTNTAFHYNSQGALEEVAITGPSNIRVTYKYDGAGFLSSVMTFTVGEKFGSVVSELTQMSEYKYEW